MRAHVIESGKVANTIEVDSLDVFPGLLDASIGGKIGDLWDGTTFTAPLRDLAVEKATLIKKIDADTDAIVQAVIGNRASEYELAEKEAKDYKNVGYPASPVPGSVSAWAVAKGWTNTKAADDIIATATGWRTAQASIRANRLSHKEDARNAADVTALDAVKASWAAFLVTIKGQLGV